MPGDTGDCMGTPLNVASRFAQCDRIALLLLCSGAQVDAVSALGRTPLHTAIACCNHAVASLLIGAGADLNTRTDTERGETPLTIAVAYNHPTMTQLLCAAGAKPNFTDGCAKPPPPTPSPSPPPRPADVSHCRTQSLQAKLYAAATRLRGIRAVSRQTKCIPYSIVPAPARHGGARPSTY